MDLEGFSADHAKDGIHYPHLFERQFHLQPDEAYIWDCATLPAWRGRRLYSALVSRMAQQLAGEGFNQIWIGASLQNQPSIRGIANAGFAHVLDLSYRRLWRLSAIWMRRASAARPLMADAYRLLSELREPVDRYFELCKVVGFFFVLERQPLRRCGQLRDGQPVW